MNREFASLADDFMTLGLLPPGSDKDTIVPALTGVFQVFACAPVPPLPSMIYFLWLNSQLVCTASDVDTL